MDVLRFDSATRTRLLLPMYLDIDPTGSAVEVKVGSIWYPAEWIDSPLRKGNAWTQVARTLGYFAGPNVVSPAGATVFSLGPHTTKTRVVKEADILAAESTVITVLTNA